MRSARKKSRRSTPQTVSGRCSALCTGRYIGWSGIRFSEGRGTSRSEKPHQELGREQRQPAAKHDSGNLTLRAHLPEHEGEPADDDRDQGEGSCERSGERSFEIPGGALAWTLREPASRTD